MSWECRCRPANAAAMPSTFLLCPCCGRSREHVELLYAAEAALVRGIGQWPCTVILREHVQRWWADRAADMEVEAAQSDSDERQHRFAAGCKTWTQTRSGTTFRVIDEDDAKVRRAELVRDYGPGENL